MKRRVPRTPSERRARRAVSALRRHPIRVPRSARARSGSGMLAGLVGAGVALAGLALSGGDPRVAKGLVGAVGVPLLVAWVAGAIAVGGTRWWSRLLAALVVVAALGGGVWLTLLVVDEL